tara:strand:+ start:57 stop:977 length:921 start_codon:yes stop_codon:yes gene_type:complete
MKIKNLLIAGGGGELGSFLIQHLKEKKINIFILDKKFKKKNKIKNVKFLKFDFLKQYKSQKIPKKIDIIIFLVGITGGPQSLNLKYLKKYIQINCETLINFLKKIKQINPKKIIFTSTEQIYGDNDKNNNIVKTEPTPKNFYGISKLFSEKILYNYFKDHKIAVDIIRFPRVISNNKNNLIFKIKTGVVKKGTIHLKNPNLKFNFIYINDLLSAFEKSMFQINRKFRILDIFNNSKPISLIEIAKIFKQNFKKKPTIKLIKNIDNKNHNPINLKISNNFTKKTLKWNPIFNNSQIIKKIIENNEIK